MNESNQFGSQFGSQTSRAAVDAKACAQFEAMLADAVDGLLTPEEQATFDEHARSCADCGVQLAEAQRGAAWMSLLKAEPPEPNTGLVARILAQTSVRTAAEQEALRAEQRAHAAEASLLGSGVSGSTMRAPLPASVATAAIPGVLPFRTRLSMRLRPMTHAVMQPRFMMTAAMAFFSIALTLNVTGVRLNQIHASDLRPSSLRRSFYQANAHVVRYYDNLRVVYELESRVHDLQHSADENAPATGYPSAPAGGVSDPKQKDAAPAGTKPRSSDSSGDPAGKTPDGVISRPAPNPKSGSSRREYLTPPAVQVASVAGEVRLSGSGYAAAAALEARNSFGRAL